LPLRHDLPVNLNQRRTVDARHSDRPAENVIDIRNDADRDRTALYPIQYGLQDGVIARTDGNDDLLDTVFTHYLLEVGDFAKVGHQRLQLRIRTVGLDEPDEIKPRVFA